MATKTLVLMTARTILTEICCVETWIRVHMTSTTTKIATLFAVSNPSHSHDWIACSTFERPFRSQKWEISPPPKNACGITSALPVLSGWTGWCACKQHRCAYAALPQTSMPLAGTHQHTHTHTHTHARGARTNIFSSMYLFPGDACRDIYFIDAGLRVC